jgi:hypothetical protein
VKRWETMAVVSVAALGLLAPAICRAAGLPKLSDYKFQCVAAAKGDFDGGNSYQMGGVNSKGQMSFVISVGGERVYAYDGTKVIRVSDDSIALPDGAHFQNDVWTSLGINDNGKVVWIASTDSALGQHYVMTYDINTAKYEIVARPGDAVDGGGKFGSGESWGASARWYANINNKDQVAFNANVLEGNDSHSGVFMYDPATKKVTKVAHPGDTVGGKKLTNAWWPSINDAGQVVFIGNVDDSEDYGIYVADGKGNISPISPPGTKVDALTLSSSRWPAIANNGDIAFVGDVGASQGGASDPNATDDAGVFLYSAADKKLHTIVKPGDAVPGGVFHGVANRRRTVQVNSLGQVSFPATREDGGDGIYVFQGGKIEALMLGGTTVAGLGKVDGVTVGNGGVTGWHFAMSEAGHIAFPAVVDGTECYVLATPPAPTAGQ